MATKAQVSAGKAPTTFTGGMNAPLRGLSAVRLSVLTDETTSPERQRTANHEAAAALGIDLGDREAVDLGVSASKTTPFQRPELGAWLTERVHEFDALCFWRFDRAIRSMADMSGLVEWARTHRKMIVFAEGPGGRLVLDFRNGVDLITQLIIQVFAFAAEFEAQSIRERVTGAQAAMRLMPLRWRGSRPPYGYMPAELEGGGWTLTPDPEAVAVIERIIAALADGKTVSAIAEKLNTEDVPSPRDYWALKKGRETGGKTGGAKGESAQRDRFRWTPAVVTRILRNPNLLGWKMHNGAPVRDDKGAPVLLTNEPILTREEFDAVGALLDARSIDNRERKDTDALLLRVIHCDSCGSRMYLNKQARQKHPTYKCNAHGRGVRCDAPASVRGDWVDEYVEREFLRSVGGLRVTSSRVIPGYDPQPEIEATAAEYEAHMASEGTQTNPVTRKLWEKRRDALDARISELLGREATPERVVTEDTGRTYADTWEEADTTKRRAMLVDAGAHLSVKRGTRGGWRRLDESRVRFTVRANFYSDAALELAAIGEVEAAA
ncbi:recombinase family protein [Streptomyces sp. NPDC056405]|uniref:recombinase family protein n=1 Tax=Streptomyces sp. NPDC056405 TaxID=3345811 RepID=UPI0035D6AEE4